MSGTYFTAPETVRLTLRNGEWIEVKADLNNAEEQALDTAAWVERDGKMVLDLSHQRTDRMAAWLVAWSLKGPDGKATNPTRENIELLVRGIAHEIDAAIRAHAERVEAEQSPQAADVAIAHYRQLIADLETAKNVTTPG